MPLGRCSGSTPALVEREDALDHGAAAHADMAPTMPWSTGVEAVGAKRVVEAVDQVGRGVDQRAVEVEDDDRRAHGFPDGCRLTAAA